MCDRERRAASYSLAADYAERLFGDESLNAERVRVLATELDAANAEVRRLSAALDEQQRENERQADLIDEFRKRNESQDRIRKRLISERDALQVDNSVQFDRAERAEAALADLRAKVDAVKKIVTDGGDGVFDVREWGERGTPFSNGAKQMARRVAAALAAAPSGEPK